MLGSRKILELIALGDTPLELLLLQKFLPRMAALISLTVLAGMLIGSIFIGGLLVSYYAFLEEGLEVMNAVMITGGIALGLAVIVVAGIITALRNVFSFGFSNGNSILKRVKNVGQAFVDGFSEVR